ncbi:hypothetical protein NFI96_003490 [Prochilodus magdalenae]|nr:hypothetical protein NFI96_003490 [Prochilodus magdalenae]
MTEGVGAVLTCPLHNKWATASNCKPAECTYLIDVPDKMTNGCKDELDCGKGNKKMLTVKHLCKRERTTVILFPMKDSSSLRPPHCAEEEEDLLCLHHDMNDCYSRLRRLVPTIPPHKKVSRVEILQHVIDYILDLQLALEAQPALWRPASARTPLAVLNTEQGKQTDGWVARGVILSLFEQVPALALVREVSELMKKKKGEGGRKKKRRIGKGPGKIRKRTEKKKREEKDMKWKKGLKKEKEKRRRREREDKGKEGGREKRKEVGERKRTEKKEGERKNRRKREEKGKQMREE